MAKKDIQLFTSVLFSSREFAHKAHLSSKSYSEHMALGSFYDDVIDMADSLVEYWQGRNLELLDDIASFKTTGDKAVEVLKKHLKMLEDSRDAVAGNDKAMQNLIDNIVVLYVSTIYKLTFLK